MPYHQLSTRSVYSHSSNHNESGNYFRSCQNSLQALWTIQSQNSQAKYWKWGELVPIFPGSYRQRRSSRLPAYRQNSCRKLGFAGEIRVYVLSIIYMLQKNQVMWTLRQFFMHNILKNKLLNLFYFKRFYGPILIIPRQLDLRWFLTICHIITNTDSMCRFKLKVT